MCVCFSVYQSIYFFKPTHLVQGHEKLTPISTDHRVKGALHHGTCRQSIAGAAN